MTIKCLHESEMIGRNIKVSEAYPREECPGHKDGINLCYFNYEKAVVVDLRRITAFF